MSMLLNSSINLVMKLVELEMLLKGPLLSNGMACRVRRRVSKKKLHENRAIVAQIKIFTFRVKIA